MFYIKIKLLLLCQRYERKKTIICFLFLYSSIKRIWLSVLSNFLHMNFLISSLLLSTKCLYWYANIHRILFLHFFRWILTIYMYIFNSTIIVLINPIYYKCKTMYIPPPLLQKKKKKLRKLKTMSRNKMNLIIKQLQSRNPDPTHYIPYYRKSSYSVIWLI